MNADPTIRRWLTTSLRHSKPESFPVDREADLPQSPGSQSGLTTPFKSEPQSKTVVIGEVKIFFSTFFTIFLAELGDKTQVTTLLMSAESRSPWIVFFGAGLALVLTSFLGVLVGKWLSTRVSLKTLETTTGSILMIISLLLLWDVVHL